MNKFMKITIPMALFAGACLLPSCQNKKQPTINDYEKAIIEAKYGSEENFNEQRKALGVDPAYDTKRALWTIDSIENAPIYKKYGYEQIPYNATEEEKLEAKKTESEIYQLLLKDMEKSLNDLIESNKRITKELSEAINKQDSAK